MYESRRDERKWPASIGLTSKWTGLHYTTVAALHNPLFRPAGTGLVPSVILPTVTNGGLFSGVPSGLNPENFEVQGKSSSTTEQTVSRQDLEWTLSSLKCYAPSQIAFSKNQQRESCRDHYPPFFAMRKQMPWQALGHPASGVQ